MGAASPSAVVIAHRGACAYLPEHSLEAKMLAHAQGAHFLEQDIVATADAVPIVFHDLYLDAMTDVRAQFPGRARADGLNYCADFSWAEIQRLRLHERRDLATGRPLRPQRFAHDGGHFRIPSLHEELELVRSLNLSTGRVAGVYPEIKAPAWHQEQGCDLTGAVLDLLGAEAWLPGEAPAFLQCFEAASLRVASERLPELPRIQLLPATGDTLPLEEIAGYAQGIGPSLGMLWEPGRGSTGLSEAAHELGLRVHPYTFRADDIPEGFGSFDELLEIFLGELGCDGLFVEQPDRMLRWLENQRTLQ